jgi:GTP-binding protein YchF
MIRLKRVTRIGAAFYLVLFCLFLSNGCDSFQAASSFRGHVISLGRQQQRRRSIGHPPMSLIMKIRVGICGLPNVGKSTLFNALAQQAIAQVANFPFCTIDPNYASLAIPDPYLESLGKLADSQRTVPATMEWIDVAGLAKGAHRGEGLGNRFLATLRECHAICHVVRAFDDENIVHVDGKVDPVNDAEIIHLELLYADLAHVERRMEKTNVDVEERAALEQVANGLRNGIPAKAIGLSTEAEFSIKSMGLLTLKPMLYAFNVDEVDYTLGREQAVLDAEKVLQLVQYCDASRDRWTLVSAKFESELSLLSEEAQVDYLASLGMEDVEQAHDLFCYNVLPFMVKELLDLSVVYTGPGVPPERSRTTRAHLVSSLTAAGLAGRLHGDIQQGFIRAEVTPASVLLEHSSYPAAKDAGCTRTEGRDYVLNSGDVVLVKWK